MNWFEYCTLTRAVAAASAAVAASDGGVYCIYSAFLSPRMMEWSVVTLLHWCD